MSAILSWLPTAKGKYWVIKKCTTRKLEYLLTHLGPLSEPIRYRKIPLAILGRTYSYWMVIMYMLLVHIVDKVATGSTYHRQLNLIYFISQLLVWHFITSIYIYCLFTITNMVCHFYLVCE